MNMRQVPRFERKLRARLAEIREQVQDALVQSDALADGARSRLLARLPSIWPGEEA